MQSISIGRRVTAVPTTREVRSLGRGDAQADNPARDSAAQLPTDAMTNILCRYTAEVHAVEVERAPDLAELDASIAAHKEALSTAEYHRDVYAELDHPTPERAATMRCALERDVSDARAALAGAQVIRNGAEATYIAKVWGLRANCQAALALYLREVTNAKAPQDRGLLALQESPELELPGWADR